VKIAIYCRVSTTKQDNENQLAQLHDFATKQQWQVFDNYIDSESASTSDRVEFQRMFADASKRKFDLVLFWALDRFSREGVLDTLQHFNRLESYGVGFRSFTEPFFDSCGEFKDAVVAIMATLARQERIKRAERTRAGLAIARARGKRLGRPNTVKTHSADVARLRSQGHSLRAIGKSLGISEGSVRRLASRTA
jgi:DNA invertase Pin-like site-specific DNA recombinase